MAIAGLATTIFASLLVFAAPGVSASNQWVTIVDFSFTPSNIAINVGDTVTWQNNATSTQHTATSVSAPPGGAFDSGIIAPGGGTYALTFSVAGSYSYHCSIHVSMTGTITVTSGVPEFSSFTFAAVGLLAMVLGLLFVRRSK